MWRFVLLFIFVAGSLQAQELGNAQRITTNDWVDPLWRSAICPGWGQEYNQEEIKAWVIGGTTWALFAGAVGTYVWAVQAENNYNGLGAGRNQSDFDGAYNNWENAATANHICYVFFGLAYAYNLFDAATYFKRTARLKPGRKPLSVELSLVDF